MKYQVLLSVLITGCASQPDSQPSAPPQPPGEYKWRNEQLYAQADAGIIQEAQLKHEFVLANNTCKIESLKVPVPSPSCTQPPRQDCTGLTGFALGFCRSYAPQPRCDYSSVNAAREAQSEIYNSCMVLRGWTKTWMPYGYVWP